MLATLTDGESPEKQEDEAKCMAITPYLLYEDVGGALKFLAKAFGFRKFGAQMLGLDRKINHAAMRLGDDVIMMGRPGSGYRNPKRLGQATQSLYINVKGVDKHFRRARKAGACTCQKLDRPQRVNYSQECPRVKELPSGSRLQI